MMVSGKDTHKSTTGYLFHDLETRRITDQPGEHGDQKSTKMKSAHGRLPSRVFQPLGSGAFAISENSGFFLRTNKKARGGACNFIITPGL